MDRILYGLGSPSSDVPDWVEENHVVGDRTLRTAVSRIVWHSEKDETFDAKMRKLRLEFAVRGIAEWELADTEADGNECT